jgi:tetratricopeptide (TPR) repeat protein
MTTASLHAAVLACALCLCLGAPRLAAAQAGSRLTQRPELKRLDELLASGDTTAADTLLKTLEPELGKNDRLAFDTIYVLVGRGRHAEAKAQWNLLAPRLQERLHAAGAAAGKPGAKKEQRLAAEALFTQALLVARGGDAKEALQLMQQADGLGFPPLDSPLMLLAAECLIDLREYDLAIGAYRAFLKQQPSNVAARAALGAALYSRGKLQDARKELEEVVRVAPKTPRANYTLGAVLFEQKAYEDARSRLERELALDPRCTPCLSRLAHIAYLEGDDARCESWLAKATAIDQADIEAQLVAGMLALRGRRYDAAIEHLSRVVARSPDFPTARYQLATAYRRAGNAERAREHLEAYKKLLDEQKAREIGVRGSR